MSGALSLKTNYIVLHYAASVKYEWIIMYKKPH